MIKGAIFDLDHTLFDRYATLRAIFNTAPSHLLPTKKEVGRDEVADAFIHCDKHFIHLGWERMYDELGKLGVLRADAQRDGFFSKYMYPLYMTTAVPYSFTVSTLQKLKDMGIKIGLITNGTHELQYKKLDMLSITDMFDEIITSGDYGAEKPDIGIFKEMAKKINLEPHQMLYIGDNPENDVEPSRKAGYIPVWVKTTGHWCFPEIEKPELQVDTIEAIPQIIKEMNERKK